MSGRWFMNHETSFVLIAWRKRRSRTRSTDAVVCLWVAGIYLIKRIRSQCDVTYHAIRVRASVWYSNNLSPESQSANGLPSCSLCPLRLASPNHFHAMLQKEKEKRTSCPYDHCPSKEAQRNVRCSHYSPHWRLEYMSHPIPSHAMHTQPTLSCPVAMLKHPSQSMHMLSSSSALFPDSKAE